MGITTYQMLPYICFFLNIPILYLLCYACHKAYFPDFHPDCGGAVEPYIRHDYKIDKGEASTNL